MASSNTTRANYLAMRISLKYLKTDSLEEKLNYNTALGLISLSFQFDDPKIGGRYLKKAERIANLQTIEEGQK